MAHSLSSILMASPAQAQLPVQPKPLWTRIDDLASMMTSLNNSIKSGQELQLSNQQSSPYALAAASTLAVLVGSDLEVVKLIIGAFRTNTHDLELNFTLNTGFGVSVVRLGAGQWWDASPAGGTYVKLSSVYAYPDPAAGGVGVALNLIYQVKV